MELTRDDVVKFYYFQDSYCLNSPNIAIVGDLKKYKSYVKQYKKKYKPMGATIYENKEKNVCTIFLDDIEITLIHVKYVMDLFGRKFRKFI